MKIIRITLSLLSFFLVLGTTSAQSQKLKDKATGKVTELNEMLTSIDVKHALSESQNEEVYNVYLNGMMEMKAAKKATTDKEAGKQAKKLIRKTMNKTIKKEILTRKQRKVLKEAKAKTKE